MLSVQGLWFWSYNTSINSFNKHIKEGCKCYKMLRVQSLGFGVYKTLVNPCNKHLQKSYKTLAKKL